MLIVRRMTSLRATIGFRANEAAAAGRERVIHYFSRNFKDPDDRGAAAEYIDMLIRNYGPVVEGYPSWHPFTATATTDRSAGCSPEFSPQGFEGLDHTIYFRDAFVTAPYGNAERVLKSAGKIKNMDAEEITDVKLYTENATPVLVTCDGIDKEEDGTILKRYALGSMLSTELPGWTWAQCGESWEDMRRHILGTPCGSRSSLFVNQETGKALREVFDMLNRHELFGPVRR